MAYRVIFFSLYAFVFAISHAVFAADSHTVSNGGTETIDEHSVCRQITNNHSSGASIMVPTKTANEWHTGGSSFLQNKPSGVTEAACAAGGGIWSFIINGDTASPPYWSATAPYSPINNCTLPNPEGHSCSPVGSGCEIGTGPVNASFYGCVAQAPSGTWTGYGLCDIDGGGAVGADCDDFPPFGGCPVSDPTGDSCGPTQTYCGTFDGGLAFFVYKCQ